jgi:hypothetical protein
MNMRKAEAQHSQQNQPAPRQGKGAALESPQGERIAQLEAMVEASPQVGRLAQLAAAANNSPHMAVQRKAISAIHNSPHVTAQRRQLGSLVGDAAQREETEEQLQPKIAQREAALAKLNNTGLPDNLKSGIESLSGMSMDSVKVHYNSSQPEQLNALAYAQGSDIHVAPGQEQHLPHEAWHVVQQAQGRVKPTMQMKDGVPVNDDAGLEREADVMGGEATQMRGAGDALMQDLTQLTAQQMAIGTVVQLRTLEYKFGKQNSGFFIRGKLDLDTKMLSYMIVATDKNKGKHYKNRKKIGGTAATEQYAKDGQMTGRWLFHSMMTYYENRGVGINGIKGEWLDDHPKLAGNAKAYRDARVHDKTPVEAAKSTFAGKMANESGYTRANVTSEDAEIEYATGRQVRQEGGGMLEPERAKSRAIQVEFTRPPVEEDVD